MSKSDKSGSRISKRTRDSGGLSSNEFTKKTSTTGPYNSQFQQMLTDKGVYPDGYENSAGISQKPANIHYIRERLRVSRRSLSPSRFTDDAFEDFVRANRRATSESKATSSVISIIMGSMDNRFETEENIQFNNLIKFAPDLTCAQPDKYYGARPEQVDERVRRDLSDYIVPSTNTSLPVVPNLFFEAKGTAGRSDVAKRQIMHDNAYGARAMFQLQNYGKDTPEYDGNAYTIGSSYHAGTGSLLIYATHPMRSATGGTEFYTTQLRSFAMTDTPETCRQGIAAFRNSIDLAQEKRDHFIASANTVAQEQSMCGTDSRTDVTSATMSRSFDSETSADELALDHAVSFANGSSEPEGSRPYKRVSLHPSTHPRS